MLRLLLTDVFCRFLSRLGEAPAESTGYPPDDVLLLRHAQDRFVRPLVT